MANIMVKEVNDSRLLGQFVDFPYHHYRESSYWVAPLRSQALACFDKKANPFYESGDMQLFIAVDNGKVVGRIAAIENKAHNIHHNDRTGFFGFFECINDREVSRQLLDSAAAWLKKRGLVAMRGPVSPSTNHESGFLAVGFDDTPRLMMPYSFPYYLELMEQCGLNKVKQLWAYSISGDKVLANDKVRRVADIAQLKSGVTLRPVRMKHFQEEINTIADIYNKCWKDNWGFVPISEKAAFLMAKSMKSIVEPSLMQIAEIDGKPVGMIVTLYDYNEVLKKVKGKLFPFGIFHLINARKKISWVRMMLIGILPEHRKKGIDAILYYQASLIARKLGVSRCEGSWTLEDNDDINRIATMIGGEVYKKYNIYEKDI
ncbi:hypothetical protein [Chitinophaga sp. HK235]|uniref:hypothetical protein n=1 Tax=Chitinophaga sp. HK235 TaxID=2952571 RepID=UPI001BAB5729|nr:hypothetical protein [Chitinophaga sp. HK235]